LTLALGTTDQGIDLSLSGNGTGDLLGIGASLGIFGVRRYLTTSKTSEAKNNVAMISRMALSAYEREGVEVVKGKPTAVHTLCKSANPVPAAVPKGNKYQPSAADYATGNEKTGWPCLRVALDSPQYYQYDYRVGGGYKGPKRGGPDPGKDGFEVSAEGDLDGNGKTSLFTRTGKRVNGEMVLATQIFISDELE